MKYRCYREIGILSKKDILQIILSLEMSFKMTRNFMTWILKFSSNGTVELFEDGIIECKSSSGSLKINSGPTVILLCDVEFLVTIMPNDKLLLTRNPGPDRYEYEFKKL
jgi:hypothetical protein